jgi:PAS domain S-box-containing protein
MTNSPNDTDLASLRASPNPAWLWDGLRNRVVWANQPAILLFEGQSLFDVVDQHFDPEEPAIRTLAETLASLTPGETKTIVLDLAWLTDAPTLTAKTRLHELADGRQALLVSAEPARPIQALEADVFEQAFRLLPFGVAFLTGNGELQHGNQAFTDMAVSPIALSTLLIDGSRAERHLSQITTRNLISAIEQAATLIGNRELRMTLRKLDHPVYIAVATFEDITERRQIERERTEQGSSSVPPQLSKTAAFEKLTESLQNSISASTQEQPPSPPSKPEKPASTSKAQPVQKQPPHIAIPETIRRAMEKSGEAVVITRDGKILFSTSKAVELYGLNTGPVSSAHSALFGLPGPISSTSLPLESGDVVDVDVSVKTVPWQDGPAQQFIIRRSIVPKQAPRLQERPTPSTAPEPPAASPLRQDVETPRPYVRVPSTSAQITMSRASVSSTPAAGEQRQSRDLSQHAAPDDELKAILDVASDGIVSLDADGRILSYSAGAEAIFGHTAHEVAGQSMSELLAPESRKTWEAYIAALQGPGLASVFNDGREVTALVKQGGTVPLFLTLGRLQSTKSKARFCAVVRDITQWKHTEQELRSAKENAEESNRQKSAFLAHISHELRTPLNAIMGFSEVMQQEKFGRISNDKYRSYADDIHASGQHLLSLIDDLLDLSRIEAGKLDLDFAAINLAEISNDAIKMLQGEASTRNVVLRSSFAKGLPQIVADKRSMRQVLLNLVSNAVKFTEAGGQVIVSAMSQPDGCLVLRVKDTGIGMAADQVKSALEPFKRIPTEGRETKGTGLGLPLAKALVEANRATLSLTSELGSGTLAEIVFPTNRVLAE